MQLTIAFVLAYMKMFILRSRISNKVLVYSNQTAPVGISLCRLAELVNQFRLIAFFAEVLCFGSGEVYHIDRKK